MAHSRVSFSERKLPIRVNVSVICRGESAFSSSSTSFIIYRMWHFESSSIRNWSVCSIIHQYKFKSPLINQHIYIFSYTDTNMIEGAFVIQLILSLECNLGNFILIQAINYALSSDKGIWTHITAVGCCLFITHRVHVRFMVNEVAHRRFFHRVS